MNRIRGGPRLGNWRLETVLPQAVLDELKRREAATGIYRTRLAANILINELTGDTSGRTRYYPSQKL